MIQEPETPKPEMADTFNHSPLNLGSKEIRLFQITFESDSKEPVHITIQHSELSNAPQFKALSYTWGKPRPLFPIKIYGNVFYVRRNL